MVFVLTWKLPITIQVQSSLISQEIEDFLSFAKTVARVAPGPNRAARTPPNKGALLTIVDSFVSQNPELELFPLAYHGYCKVGVHFIRVGSSNSSESFYCCDYEDSEQYYEHSTLFLLLSLDGIITTGPSWTLSMTSWNQMRGVRMTLRHKRKMLLKAK